MLCLTSSNVLLAHMSLRAFTTIDGILTEDALLQDQAPLPSSDEAGSGVCMGA